MGLNLSGNHIMSISSSTNSSAAASAPVLGQHVQQGTPDTLVQQLLRQLRREVCQTIDSHLPLDTIERLVANFHSLVRPRLHEVKPFQVGGDFVLFRYQGHIRIGYRVTRPAATNGGQHIAVRWVLLDNGVRVNAAENTHGVLVPISEVRLIPDARMFR